MGTRIEQFKGFPQIAGNNIGRLMIGTIRHQVIDLTNLTGDYADLSGGDNIENCRVIYADTEGTAKISYIDDSDGTEHTEVTTVGTSFKQVRNVTKVWKRRIVGSDTPVCTAKVFRDDGEEVYGIKIRR